jgi:hypothetical protein
MLPIHTNPLIFVITTHSASLSLPYPLRRIRSAISIHINKPLASDVFENEAMKPGQDVVRNTVPSEYRNCELWTANIETEAFRKWTSSVPFTQAVPNVLQYTSFLFYLFHSTQLVWV